MSDSDNWLELTDRSLLRRYRSGHADAATALYIRYANRLQRIAHNQTDPRIAVQVDPEGIVQSVFRTFFRRASDGHYDVIESEELWKLFLVIALNKIRRSANFHRAAKRDAANTLSLDDGFSQIANENDQMALNALRMTINEILADVPDKQRNVALLRIQGFEVGEIAEKVGRSKRSVERMLQDFRKLLRSSIDDEQEPG